MALKYLSSIDLNLNELQNAVIQLLSTAPSGIEGRFYFNSSEHKPYWYGNNKWITFPTTDEFSTLQGYFTNGIAKQAAKVTNALTFTAGQFTSLSSYDGSAARELKIPTKTSHITEEGNLYFTTQRVYDAITGGASSILIDNLEPNKALISSSIGKVAVSAITTTELNRLSGVSSNIQQQLDGKVDVAGDTMTGTLYFGSTTHYIDANGNATLNSLTIGNVVLEQDSDGILKFRHKNNTSVANIYATGGVSALGKSDSTDGGTGGGLIQSVYGSVNLGDTFSDTDLTNTFNAYTINAIHKRVSALENYFGSDDDDVINKWNEIVDFINGTEGTTLSGILSQYTTTSNIRSLVISLNGTAKQTYSPTASGNSTINFKAGSNIELSYAANTITIANTYQLTQSAVSTVLGFTPKQYKGNVTFSNTDTSKTVTHNLGTQDVQVVIYDSSGHQVFMDVQANNTNSIVLNIGQTFSTSTTFKVVILA